MSDRILGRSGSRRRRFWRRRFLFLPLIAIGAAAVVMSNALAVHDDGFQLDGDTNPATGDTSQAKDWNDIFGETDPAVPPEEPTVTLPTGFNAAGFHTDFLTKTGRGGAVVFDTGDNTTYATGSKDTLPIQNPGGWQCAHSNNVGGKVDIMNAYAASYIVPAGEQDAGDQILYFGQERFANDGDANVGFWFIQDSTVGCSSPSGGKAVNFAGEHQDGDLFIVSAFTAGGDVSGIDVYRWDGDDATGSLTGPVTLPNPSGDCESLPPPPDTPPDSACATVNKPDDGANDPPDGTIETPWVTANKDDGLGHSLRTSEFFEGGLNLTDIGLAGKCFNTFVSNTRSSQSLTATIFDFDVGQLPLCGISTAQNWLPNDTATVTGSVAGDVDFTLYTKTGDCTEDGDATTNDVVTFPNRPISASGTAETNNTTEVIDEGITTISWSAVFDPTDPNVAPITSRCEASELTIDNDVGPVPPPAP